MQRRTGSRSRQQRVSAASASQKKDDYSQSYNIFNKIQTQNMNGALKMGNGFQSTAKLKKRLNSPLPDQQPQSDFKQRS